MFVRVCLGFVPGGGTTRGPKSSLLKENMRGYESSRGCQDAHTSLRCTPRGSCNNTLLRRVLRRFSNNKCFLEGLLEGAWKGFQ